MPTNQDFTYSNGPNPHTQRAQEILRKYPQLTKYMGPYPMSFLIILSLTLVQLLLSFTFKSTSWPMIILYAWLIGAFISHALFVMIHEATHNLIFRPTWANQWAGMVCNISQVMPSSAAFCKYHIYHHTHLGEYDFDADLPDRKEARYFGEGPIKKLIWLSNFFLIESFRPKRLKIPMFDRWVTINIFFILITNILIFYFFGLKPFVYLALSTLFSVGLHPLGARWIQEHYTFKEGQETYSYYGPLNYLAFNVGLHNEHHDLWKVPWIHLPKIKRTAPEYYENLFYHKSWLKLLVQFLFNRDISLFKRIIRPSKS